MLAVLVLRAFSRRHALWGNECETWLIETLEHDAETQNLGDRSVCVAMRTYLVRNEFGSGWK